MMKSFIYKRYYVRDAVHLFLPLSPLPLVSSMIYNDKLLLSSVSFFSKPDRSQKTRTFKDSRKIRKFGVVFFGSVLESDGDEPRDFSKDVSPSFAVLRIDSAIARLRLWIVRLPVRLPLRIARPVRWLYHQRPQRIGIGIDIGGYQNRW